MHSTPNGVDVSTDTKVDGISDGVDDDDVSDVD